MVGVVFPAVLVKGVPATEAEDDLVRLVLLETQAALGQLAIVIVWTQEIGPRSLRGRSRRS